MVTRRILYSNNRLLTMDQNHLKMMRKKRRWNRQWSLTSHLRHLQNHPKCWWRRLTHRLKTRKQCPTMKIKLVHPAARRQWIKHRSSKSLKRQLLKFHTSFLQQLRSKTKLQPISQIPQSKQPLYHHHQCQWSLRKSMPFRKWHKSSRKNSKDSTSTNAWTWLRDSWSFATPS